MPRKYARQSDPRFDNRHKTAMKRSDFYDGCLYGLAAMAPDQSHTYKRMKPAEREKAWSLYSCKILMIAADMNNQFRDLNK